MMLSVLYCDDDDDNDDSGIAACCCCTSTDVSKAHKRIHCTQAGFGSVVDAAYSFPLVASYMLNTRWRVELDVASARAYVCCCSGFFEPELNFNDFG